MKQLIALLGFILVLISCTTDEEVVSNDFAFFGSDNIIAYKNTNNVDLLSPGNGIIDTDQIKVFIEDEFAASGMVEVNDLDLENPFPKGYEIAYNTISNKYNLVIKNGGGGFVSFEGANDTDIIVRNKYLDLGFSNLDKISNHYKRIDNSFYIDKVYYNDFLVWESIGIEFSSFQVNSKFEITK